MKRHWVSANILIFYHRCYSIIERTWFIYDSLSTYPQNITLFINNLWLYITVKLYHIHQHLLTDHLSDTPHLDLMLYLLLTSHVQIHTYQHRPTNYPCIKLSPWLAVKKKKIKKNINRIFPIIKSNSLYTDNVESDGSWAQYLFRTVVDIYWRRTSWADSPIVSDAGKSPSFPCFYWVSVAAWYTFISNWLYTYSTLAKFMKIFFTSYWNSVKNGKLKSFYLLNGWSYNFFVNG